MSGGLRARQRTVDLGATEGDPEVRAGSRVLLLFKNPLTMQILRMHAEGPQRLANLEEQLNWTAPTTIRVLIRSLCEIGALQKREVASFPHAVASELTAAGQELLFVADQVEAWLARCPAGPIDPTGGAAKAAIKALAGGWNSSLIRALASRPCTLTELAGLIPGVSYPTLERRLSWMRRTGQIEPAEKVGRGTPYMVTEWLRLAVAPLCAAGRCERRYMGVESGRVTNVEVEAAFLLALPLVPLCPSADGRCVLAVHTGPSEPKKGDQVVGVAVGVERGRVVSCSAEVAPDLPSWALGDPAAWFDAVIEGRLDDLFVGGSDPQLVLELVSGLHLALYAR